MDCKRDREEIVAFVDDELEAAARAELESHLATCAACREEVAAQRALGDMFGALREVTPAGDFEASFWARIARERDESQAGFGARLRGLFTLPRALALGVAAAAALVFAINLPREASTPEDTGPIPVAVTIKTKIDPDVRIVSNPKDFELLQDPDMDAIADVDVLEAWDDASPS